MIPGYALPLIHNASLASLDRFPVGVAFQIYPPSLLHYFISRRPNLRSWDSLMHVEGGGGREDGQETSI